MKCCESERLRRRVQIGTLVTLFSCLASLPAHADSLKLGGAWLPEATVERIEAGQIYFVNANGSTVNRPLKDVQAVRVTSQPKVTQAEELLEKRDLAKAYALYSDTRNGLKEKWLQNWVDARLVRCADELGKGYDATVAYLRLVQAGADDHFLSRLPEASLANLDVNQKQNLIERTTSALKSAQGKKPPASTLLAELKASLDRVNARPVEVAVVPQPAAQPSPGTAKPPTPGGSGTSNPKPAPAPAAQPGSRPKSVVIVPLAMDADDDVVARSLRTGQFDRAEEEAAKILNAPEPDSMSKRLYQLGLAQANLAAGLKGDDQYRKYCEAGLNLMRAVIYFPQGEYASAASMEAGWVHLRLGRADLAKKMMTEAEHSLDPDDEQLAERLSALRKAISNDR